MSSNIKIQKNCEFCGDEFTARTLYTRYCSKSCNKKHYKQLLLEKNLDTKQTQESIKISPIEILRNTSQEYFEVHEAAQIMRILTTALTMDSLLVNILMICEPTWPDAPNMMFIVLKLNFGTKE